MPSVPATSPTTGASTSADFVHTTSCAFVDAHGRTLLLRGVNLSGASKAPVSSPSYQHDGFWEDAEAGGKSFVGRPLDLEDGSADVHLARLRGWGFNMLRFPFTWEALEHEGPGKYDFEFMDYVVRVLRKCKEHGFKVYMDPHQDVWSRFSGGSGAPFWTLPACGIDPAGITPTLSAIVHSEYPSAERPDPASVPAMIWGTNYGRLLPMTIFTFFFGGRTFAPKCVIDGQNIQDWLQGHFIAAVGQLADRIASAGDLADTCVLGWDSMNEPHHGLIGHHDLRQTANEGANQLKKGPTPTPAQSFRLGMGTAQTIENWTFGAFGPSRSGSVTIDPKGARLWASPGGDEDVDGVSARWGWRRDAGWELGTCPWAQHGVWDERTGQVLRPDYFRADDFVGTFWRAHYTAYAMRVRAAQPEAILFVAPPVFAPPPPIDEDLLQGRACLSTHYYDGLTLITRHWNWFNADALGVLRGKYATPALAAKFGEPAIRKSFQEQLGVLKADADVLGAYPTIIGEIGIPYDMDGRAAYGYTDGGRHKGDYSRHQRALDASLNACDGPNALNYSVWTYVPDHSHRWGDGWNMEDLSLWSPDDLRPRAQRDAPGSRFSTAALKNTVRVGKNTSDAAAVSGNAYDFLTDGARAVKAFARPYPVATVGAPVNIAFDIGTTEFRLTVRVTPDDAQTPLVPASPVLTVASHTGGGAEPARPTEIFVPLVHYAHPTLLAQAERGADAEAAAPVRGSVQGALSDSSATLLAGGAGAALLALDVRVSAGRWDVDGQTLRWWYPVPTHEDGPATYEIAIRRAGGAIRTADDRADGGVLGWCAENAGCTVM